MKSKDVVGAYFEALANGRSIRYNRLHSLIALNAKKNPRPV